jgi:hypothetical protein
MASSGENSDALQASVIDVGILPSWFCDICLKEFYCWRHYHAHLDGWMHKIAVENRNQQLERLFDVADEILQAHGTWERCFSCGALKTATVVQVVCCRCNGSGGRSPAAQGVPGIAYNEGRPRYLCRRHALDVHCRSCAAPLGIESFAVDTDALADDALAGVLQMPSLFPKPMHT